MKSIDPKLKADAGAARTMLWHNPTLVFFTKKDLA